MIHRLLPILAKSHLVLAILLLILVDLVKFASLLDLQKCLFDRLGEQHVQDRIHRLIVVKKLVISNLGHLVNANLFWNVLW